MNPTSYFPKFAGFLSSLLIMSLVGIFSGCEEIENPEPDTVSATVSGTSILLEIRTASYESCIKQNPDEPALCDSLKSEAEEQTLAQEVMERAFRGVDPKPLPIPVPPRPCPQGQCLELFEGIVAVVFPPNEKIQEVRLVAEGKVLTSAVLGRTGQYATVLDEEYQVFTLQAAEIPQDVEVAMEIVEENGTASQILN